MTEAFTKRYETKKTENGFIFSFYCDLCERGVTTREFETSSYTEAVNAAQIFAKRYFNMCHRCGRWVCDEHYNEDEMKCSKCAPLKHYEKLRRKTDLYKDIHV